MKLDVDTTKNPIQWALDMAGKTEVPYAAQVLYSKRDEIIKQCTYIENLSKGKQESHESQLQRQTLNAMARELERGAEILIIGI
tara:strand:+ start:2501 stop:2752 length:252 start_codon:yes stop_codon:yes gene_type:complete